jgi:hypothetical protein
MNLINNLDVTITRWDCGVVRSITIEAGEPDACGNRFTVSADQNDWGQPFVIQTNFSDFYEARLDAAKAMACAMSLASMIDAEGAGPEDDEVDA